MPSLTRAPTSRGSDLQGIFFHVCPACLFHASNSPNQTIAHNTDTLCSLPQIASRLLMALGTTCVTECHTGRLCKPQERRSRLQLTLKMPETGRNPTHTTGSCQSGPSCQHAELILQPSVVCETQLRHDRTPSCLLAD